MKNKKTLLGEEHIVAYLDGELDVTAQEVKSALASDKELAHAAHEYHVMTKAFARSASDERFVLSAEADTKAMAVLRKELAKKQLIDAPPVHPIRTAVPMFKQMWFRRTTVSAAFALLLGILWTSFSKNDIQVQPTISLQQPQNFPSVSTPIVDAPASEVADAVMPAATTTATPVQKRVKHAVTVATEKAPIAHDNNIAAVTEEISTPNDVMISRRYAKLVKSVPVIEITQQDKL